MLSELRLFHVIDFISQSKALSNCDLLILWNRQKVPCLVNALQNGTLSIEKLFIFAYGWVDVFCIGYTLWQSLGEKHSESFHWTLYCYCMSIFTYSRGSIFLYKNKIDFLFQSQTDGNTIKMDSQI